LLGNLQYAVANQAVDCLPGLVLCQVNGLAAEAEEGDFLSHGFTLLGSERAIQTTVNLLSTGAG
jgi:hypothetical protein